MKQVVQTQRGGKLRLAEVPEPLVRSTTVLVRTEASLISAGTERAKVEVAKKSLMGKALARPDQVRQVLQSVQQIGWEATFQKVSARLDALEPLGYSAAGVALAVGARVRGISVGDRVACGGAGLANHAGVIAVPATLCVRVPDTVPIDEACYATVGAIALQGVRQAEPRLGEVVTVIGLGLLGQLTVQMLRANGCRVIGVDVNPDRCRQALAFGADVACGPDDPYLLVAAAAYGAGGSDAVIVTAATADAGPISLAGRLSRDRGRVVVVGAVPISAPRSPFYEREIELRLSRSYGPGRYDPSYEEDARDYPVGYVRWTEGRNLGAVIDLLVQGRLDVRSLTTHRFPIEEATRAYDVVEGRTGEASLGIVLTYLAEAPPVAIASPMPTATAAPRSRVAPGSRGTLGILGAGSFAQGTLLPVLVKDRRVTLAAVATASGLTARGVADRLRIPHCGADASEVIQQPGIDAVLIATRHSSHARLVVDAVDAGKAVFVEKPLALTAEDLHRVQEAAARASDPLVMVGFNRRFAPLSVALKAFLETSPEPMLAVYRVNAGFIPPDHWSHDHEQGGGRIIGEACHFIDLLCFLTGDRVAEVTATGLPDGNRYCGDNVVATLRFARGSVATLVYQANGDKGMEKERLEVSTAGLSAVLSDFRSLTCYRSGKATRQSHHQDKGHAAELHAFVTAVVEGGPSPLPLDNAVHVTKVTFALMASVATGCTVDVPS